MQSCPRSCTRISVTRVTLPLQDAELRAALSKEKESLQQTKKQLQDAKSESLQLGMERDSLQKQLDVQQKQHQQFLDTFKATKEDESSSRTLLTESTSRCVKKPLAYPGLPSPEISRFTVAPQHFDSASVQARGNAG